MKIEAMTEILDELGISATDIQIKQIVDNFLLCIEMEREMSFYQHIDNKQECSKCKRLEMKINEFQGIIEVYRNSVMQRRNADSVWIENGSVMYK